MNNGMGFLAADDYAYSDYDWVDFAAGGGGGWGAADMYFDSGGGGGIFDDYDYDYFYGGGGDIPYAEYDPGSAWPIEETDYPFYELPTLDPTPWVVDPGYSYSDPLSQYQEFYSVYDPLGDTLYSTTSEPEQLPNIGNQPVPYTSFDYYEWPAFELPVGPIDVPPPPPPPVPPPVEQPNLPPACPQGQYHPYPIGHPQQNVCVPFPQAQQQQPKPQVQQPPPSGQGSKPPAPKPPQQQQQPSCPTYCKHPQTGQWFKTPSGYHCAPGTQACTPNAQQQQIGCPTGQVRNPATGQCVTVPQCTTPGTVFDARVGRCVPFAQAQQPLCPPGYTPNFQTQRCEIAPPTGTESGEFDDVLNSLKTIPWWVWAALGGFLVLSRKDEDGRTTTVRYRRASA